MNYKSYQYLPTTSEQMLRVGLDVVIVIFSTWMAFSMRFGLESWPETNYVFIFMSAPLIAIPIFIRFKFYHTIIRYVGFNTIWSIVQASFIYVLLWWILIWFSELIGMTRSIFFNHWFVATLLLGGSRILVRWAIVSKQNAGTQRNVVIYGAGNAGAQLASALIYSAEIKPVAFIDDNPSIQKRQINGIPVEPLKNLSQFIYKLNVEEVLLAIPSISRKRRREIFSQLKKYPVHLRTLPVIEDLAQGQVKVDDIRNVDIADILGRDPVPPNQELLNFSIRDKVAMVTGAGGSIGAEICKQIRQLEPRKVILFEQNEYSLYAIENELSNYKDHFEIIPILGSVLDQSLVESVCDRFGVQTIYHSAAFKHVPIIERNPFQGVLNNIFGTYHCAQAAFNYKVDNFVLISSDKAVRPTNIMGATKRFAEHILQGLDASIRNKSLNKKIPKLSTKFVSVRFGNVLDSSGSVIPLFRKQIREGGPVTVTDEKVVRYFMTISEAAELVIQAGSMGKGGDVYVLDMGDPVSILEMARQMIHLSGLELKDEKYPDGDIEIIFTGLRPGEKLYEELLISGTSASTTHERIMCANENNLSWDEVQSYLRELKHALENSDLVELQRILIESVEGYSPESEV